MLPNVCRKLTCELYLHTIVRCQMLFVPLSLETEVLERSILDWTFLADVVLAIFSQRCANFRVGLLSFNDPTYNDQAIQRSIAHALGVMLGKGQEESICAIRSSSALLHMQDIRTFGALEVADENETVENDNGEAIIVVMTEIIPLM